MIRILFLLIAIIVALFILKKILTGTGKISSVGKFKIFSFVVGGVVILLALTGRLNWLITVLGLIMAALARWMPVFLRYAPQIGRLFYIFRSTKQQAHWQNNENKNQNRNFHKNNQMSLDEAYEILNLHKGASKVEIVNAHRKLMQKMHPDRGGNNYFAAKINLAKKVLLEN